MTESEHDEEMPATGFALLGIDPARPIAPVAPPAVALAHDSLTRRQHRERNEAIARAEREQAIRSHHTHVPAALRKRSSARIPAKTLPSAHHEPGSPEPRSLRARAASKLLSASAMLFAGALMIGMSIPANAFFTISYDESTPAAESLPAQSMIVASTVIEATPARDNFGVISYAEQLRLKYGNRTYSFTATTGAVRWPFPYAVPISDGWGERVAPCRGCSSYHKGVDFTPGAGAPIYAIADGVVSYSEVSAGGFGNHVIIDHVIAGQQVQSIYAHMQMSSSPLVTGMAVKVGDFVGLVGSTGASVGAHLHFEIRLEGVPVDPYAWLQANAVN